MNVRNSKDDVGLVDDGFLNTVEIRAIITVFTVASELNGFENVIRVPELWTVAVHGVWI